MAAWTASSQRTVCARRRGMAVIWWVHYLSPRTLVTVIVTLQVRESDRKPGSYVLSYLGKTGVNHFRVTAVCGDYYIGGRQFDSLQDLIGYYTHIRWTNNQYKTTNCIYFCRSQAVVKLHFQ